MKEFLTKNFSTLLIALLVIFLWSKGVFKSTQPAQPTVVIVSDTTNKQHTGSVTNTSKEIQYIPYRVEVVKEVMKDSDEVKKIVEDYLSTHVQQSSLDIPDSLGHVTATTYTTKNKVDSTKWDYKINERIITNTITKVIPEKKYIQLFFGGGPAFDVNKKFYSIGADLLIKNKKDRILGVTSQIDRSRNISIGLKVYWKL